MLSLPMAVRIFAYSGITDMRRSFDALARMRVRAAIEQHPDELQRQIDASGLKRSTFFQRRKELHAGK